MIATTASTLRCFLIGIFLLCLIPVQAWACLFPTGARAQNKPPSCVFQEDCPSNTVCFEARCVPHTEARDEPWTESRSEQPTRWVALPDDGGADAICGADRRCRIERIKSRNRQRRYLEIAIQERAVEREVERVLTREIEEVNRIDKPWHLALLVRAPSRVGLQGGRTFQGRFRAAADFTYGDPYVFFSPNDTSLPTVEGYHSLFLFGVHGTYLPSTRWLTPTISAGFQLGNGSYGSWGSSNTDTVYHILTGAVGAETQFKGGFHMGIALRHGRVIYNQARLGAGVYDRPTRDALQEYMNREGNLSFDLTIGWAF